MISALLVPLVLAGVPTEAVRAAGDDPPVRIILNEDGRYQPGDRGRVRVEVADDGYLLVFHVDPDGDLRVLFPLDPTDDNFVRGGKRYELLDRGGRESFRIERASGSGVIYAAVSRAPFRFDEFTVSEHWDYHALAPNRVGRDPEPELTALAQRMAGGSFDYDIYNYTVIERVYVTDSYSGPTYIATYGGCDPWYGYGCGGYGYGSFFSISIGYGRPYFYRPYFYRPYYYRPRFFGPYHYGYYPYGYYRPYYYRPYAYRPWRYDYHGYYRPNRPYPFYGSPYRDRRLEPYPYGLGGRTGYAFRDRGAVDRRVGYDFTRSAPLSGGSATGRRLVSGTGRATNVEARGPAGRSGVRRADGRGADATPMPRRVGPGSQPSRGVAGANDSRGAARGGGEGAAEARRVTPRNDASSARMPVDASPRRSRESSAGSDRAAEARRVEPRDERPTVERAPSRSRSSEGVRAAPRAAPRSEPRSEPRSAPSRAESGGDRGGRSSGSVGGGGGGNRGGGGGPARSSDGDGGGGAGGGGGRRGAPR